MPQPTLNDPLDSAEFIDVALARIRRAMEADSVIGKNVEHPRFSWEFRAKFPAEHTKETLVWGQVGAPFAPGEEVVEITDTYSSDSPNRTREDHNLPIPVMVQTPSGPEKRKIHVNPPTRVGRPPKTPPATD